MTAGRSPGWAARRRVVPVQCRIDRLPALFGDWGGRILERTHAQSSVSGRGMIGPALQSLSNGLFSTDAVQRSLLSCRCSLFAIQRSPSNGPCSPIAVQRSLVNNGCSGVTVYHHCLTMGSKRSLFNHWCSTISVQPELLNHWRGKINMLGLFGTQAKRPNV